MHLQEAELRSSEVWRRRISFPFARKTFPFLSRICGLRKPRTSSAVYPHTYMDRSPNTSSMPVHICQSGRTRQRKITRLASDRNIPTITLMPFCSCIYRIPRRSDSDTLITTRWSTSVKRQRHRPSRLNQSQNWRTLSTDASKTV